MLQSRNQAGVVSLEWAAARVYIGQGARPVTVLAKLPLEYIPPYSHSVHWWKLPWLWATERKDKDTGKNQSSETVFTAFLGLSSIYLPLWGSIIWVCFLCIIIYLFLAGLTESTERQQVSSKYTFTNFYKLYYELESFTVSLQTICWGSLTVG